MQRLDAEAPITKAEVFFQLGDISRRQGDPKRAIQMLERAIESDPGLRRAQAMLTELKQR